MNQAKMLNVIPVLPSLDIDRDLKWYNEKLGFNRVFGDNMYAGIKREDIRIHLQWHADTKDDPLLGGSVIKIFVEEIEVLFLEMVSRGTVKSQSLRMNTAWKTHEFGVYDLNKNAIFFVEDVIG